MPPKLAAILVAFLLGRLDIAPELVRICERESRCAPTGIHERDARFSQRGWRSQVRLGHLDPKCQPYEPRAWATRGPWGLSAASHWAFMPTCYAPRAFDFALVSALVAARKWMMKCEGRRGRARSKWC